MQQVIPLPEAADYQIQIREKEQKERKEKADRRPLHKFWESLLVLGEGKTPLHAKMLPSERRYIGAGVGISKVGLYYTLLQHGSRVELYIFRSEAAANKRIFDELLSHKEEIEAVFGEPLTWNRLDAKKACLISYEMMFGGYKDDEANWPTIQMAMIDAMARFEKALAPFIAKLKT